MDEKTLRDEALAIVGNEFKLLRIGSMRSFDYIAVLRWAGTKSASWRVLHRSNMANVSSDVESGNALFIARSVFDKEVAGLRRGSVALVEFPRVGPAHVRLAYRKGPKFGPSRRVSSR